MSASPCPRVAGSCRALAAALLLAGCNQHPDSPIVCTAIFVPALSVTVVDSVSGAPAANGASLLAVDGTFRDSSAMVTESALISGFDRPGTYSLTVRAAGYRDWTQAGVVVTGDACHVTTRYLTARLQH